MNMAWWRVLPMGKRRLGAFQEQGQSLMAQRDVPLAVGSTARHLIPLPKGFPPNQVMSMLRQILLPRAPPWHTYPGVMKSLNTLSWSNCHVRWPKLSSMGVTCSRIRKGQGCCRPICSMNVICLHLGKEKKEKS